MLTTQTESARQLVLGLSHRSLSKASTAAATASLAAVATPLTQDALITHSNAQQLTSQLWARTLPDGYLAMTPLQEIANAFTMLIPAACAVQTVGMAPGMGCHLVAAAILLHFPFSVAYHVACAAQPAKHPVVGNNWCKGDLIAIHLAGASMSLATSGARLSRAVQVRTTCVTSEWLTHCLLPPCSCTYLAAPVTFTRLSALAGTQPGL